jgi:hypothetical protein
MCYKIKKLHFATECMYRFRMVLTIKSDCLLNNISRLVFIMHTECVLCEVSDKFLYDNLDESQYSNG